MKLTITIDLLPSEVETFVNALTQKQTPPVPAPEPEQPPPRIVRVSDSAINASSAFWINRIGALARLIHEGPDGFWDVRFDCDSLPMQGVDPARFK